MLRMTTGLDSLVDEKFLRLKGKRVGVLCHPASVDRHYVHMLDRMREEKVDVKAIFGPEHGFLGQAQDMIGVGNTPKHAAFGCPIHSLYGDSFASLSPAPEQLEGLDVLVIDLQDIGTRYYTFVWTAVLCMRVAAKVRLPLLVLDRPNPLGGDVMEGGGVDAPFQSFVGLYDVPVRHGMTVGEMLELVKAEEKLDVPLEIVKARGWKRERLLPDMQYAWVFPSPNMPTYDTALVYPGMCLLEATNASEGRGSTRPFEIVGAGYADGQKLADALTALNEPGVVFRPLAFQPTFHKFAGKLCGGVQVHVTNAVDFHSFRVGLRFVRTLAELWPKKFQWRKEPYEFVADKNAFDLLTGTSAYREAFASDKALLDVYQARESRVSAFIDRRRDVLIYK
ncbi:MAG: DUF1343 domain-containing protein [Deltaproteobacteria bacterium]|nr:DUF1343 domain-containing protein [Deltaproteobacteria bacterium]